MNFAALTAEALDEQCRQSRLCRWADRAGWGEVIRHANQAALLELQGPRSRETAIAAHRAFRAAMPLTLWILLGQIAWQIFWRWWTNRG